MRRTTPRSRKGKAVPAASRATPATTFRAPLAILLLVVLGLSPGAAGAKARRAHGARYRSLPVEVVQTTTNLSQKLARLRDLTLQPGEPLGVPVIHVDDSSPTLKINGFGAAMTDTSAWLIYEQLPPATREMVMESLFGPAGLHLSLIRVPMGASDFSANGLPYTYDDVPRGATDPRLAQFSIAHDDAYILPALREALALNPYAELFATPWTAPPWMKANALYNNIGSLGTLLPSAYRPFAQYFVKFLEAYARAGVRITAVTPQNEPLNPTPYPGMQLPAANEAQWIVDDLAPALRAARLPTRIYGYDGGWASYPQSLLSTSARRAMSGIAWHCYGGPTQMDVLHSIDPSLDQVITECSPGLPPYPVSEVVISSVRSWASAVALWNVALDPSGGPVQTPNVGCSGCTGLITVNEQSHTVSFTRNFYQLGQISRFVPPGAYRISTENFVTYYRLSSGGYGVTPGLDDVAFLDPDGSRVLVAYNTANIPIKFGVEWHGVSFTYTVPSKATVTFDWKPA